MTWWQAVLLGALQGVTEFLPISSSGHLVLAQHFFGIGKSNNSQALFFDGAVHIGTLLAVLLYFHREYHGGLLPQFGRTSNGPRPEPIQWSSLARLAFLVGVASLPSALAVMALSDHIRDSFKNPTRVAIAFLVLGFILLLANGFRGGWTTQGGTTWRQALIIGVAQALSAVFRGLSRSGLTLSAALFVSLQREWAVRFSFLMSIVASAGLAGLGIFKALRDPEAHRWLTMEFLALTLVGIVVGGVVGYLTMRPLMRLVSRGRLWWFSIYLWLVGGFVLISGL